MTEERLLSLQGDKIYFIYNELKCPCCGECEVQEESFKMLYDARLFAGIPFVINSAYRCEDHNKKVRSVTDNHVLGVAFDIKCTASNFRYRMLDSLICAGFDRFGIYSVFIHVDNNSEKCYSVWL